MRPIVRLFTQGENTRIEFPNGCCEVPIVEGCKDWIGGNIVFGKIDTDHVIFCMTGVIVRDYRANPTIWEVE